MAEEDLEEFLVQHRALRQSLPATWNAFFARFGTLRPVQLAAIPRIVAGENVLVTAPTAGGKTEAVAAPICERLLRERWHGLSTITVTPTRALVNDLYFRLHTPTREIGIRLGRKTSDHGISAGIREQFLITTPESLESLLTFRRETLTNLRALIIDEIHLLDGSPRGDQLRWLIGRLSAYLSHARQQDGGHLQQIALSATVADPERLSAAYLGRGSKVVRVAGQRDIDATVLCAPGDDRTRAHAAVDAIAGIEDVRKVLVFVNSRRQVDVGATHYQYGLFQRLPVYGHHGSLSKHQREQVEEQFRNDEQAICVATMTLEVGIDIGDVDLVVCVDPPFSLSSFLQRIGRGCRRLNGKTRVLCMARDRAGQMLFEAYIHQARSGIPPGPTAPMRRSVLVQQVLAYLKQVGMHRRVISQFLRVFAFDNAPVVSHRFVEEVLDDMEASNLLYQRNGVFVPAQDGWDFIESSRIFSNIAPSPEQVVLIDADTGKQIASVRALEDNGIRIAGRSFDVLPGSTGARRSVRPGGQHEEAPKYHSRNLPFAFDVGASLKGYLEVTQGQLIALPLGNQLAILTWLGRLFNSALALSLTRAGHQATPTSFALHLSRFDTTAVISLLRDAVTAMNRVNLAGFKPDALVDMGPHLKYLGESGIQKARRDWLDTTFLETWTAGLSEIVVVDSQDSRFQDLAALAAT